MPSLAAERHGGEREVTLPAHSGVVAGPPPSDAGVLWPKDRTATATDGARIRYGFVGPDDGLVVALCSGFLCPDTWWAHLVPALERAGYRVLLFHYRGIAGSTVPAGAGRDAMSVPRFAADLRDVLDAEGIGAVALVGHSMGVQVALEAAALLGDDRVRALAALTGPFASPVRTLYGRGPLATYLLYEPTRLLVRLAPRAVGDRIWRAGWRRLPFLRIGRAVRAFGPRTDEDLVRGYAEHAAELPVRYALAVAEAMHGHTAEDLLPGIAVPTLVVVGGKDPFSPPVLGHRMADLLPDAVVRTAPHGTHGTVLEYPELVNGWVLDHLGEHLPVRGASASAAAATTGG